MDEPQQAERERPSSVTLWAIILTLVIRSIVDIKILISAALRLLDADAYGGWNRCHLFPVIISLQSLAEGSNNIL